MASPPINPSNADEKQHTELPASSQPSVSDNEKEGLDAPLGKSLSGISGVQNVTSRDGQPVVERTGTPAPGPPPAPPDGGLKAWLQVVGGFFLFFNTWGILNTFGVYQTYYESGELFHESSSNISWIGSIQAFLVLFVGFVSGPIFDRGYLRSLLVVGSFLIVFGHMMLSLCDTFWEVILAQGFTVGMGAGCLFIPAVAIFPAYFKKHIGLALGLAAAGSSTGGIIYPIMFYKLQGEVGFRWATRIIGFVALATLSLPVAVMQQRFKPAKARAYLDLGAFKDVHFMTFVLGAFLGFTGLYVGLFYISFYALAERITDPALAFYLVPILNAGSVFGRTVPNWLSDKVGPFNIIAPGAIITGVLLLCMMAVHSVASIVILALLFGFFSGIFVALPPVLFNVLTPDKTKIGTRVGMGFAMLSFSTLLGGPASGAILGDGRNLHWHSVWVYGGVMALVAGGIFCLLRMQRANWKLNARL